MIDQLLGHYRILSKIGEGGMGVVYRARDEYLHRDVALKVVADKYPEFGQCVHKIASHPARPERMFLQNHWGLYRSDDGAATWVYIANGVRSDFGFAMIMHPRDPDCSEHIRYTEGLATMVPDGSEISIVPAISGGTVRHRRKVGQPILAAAGFPAGRSGLHVRGEPARKPPAGRIARATIRRSSQRN